MRRHIVLASVIAAGSFAIAVFAQQAPSLPALPAGFKFPPMETIDKVAENLYFIPGAGGNTAVLVHADGVLVVDTKVPGNGEGLLNLIKKVTDKPVTHIVNTHTHFDHAGSNSEFPASVEIVTQENTKTNMAKADLYQSESGKVGLPDRAFKNRMTLFAGKDAVDLYYFGPAHTNGDAYVVFRDSRVMHAGDTFPQKGQAFVDRNNGGSSISFPDALTKAATGIKNVDKVMTGHSTVVSWQDFVDYGEFHRLYLSHARASLAAGKTPQQAMADLKLPEKFKSYNLNPGKDGTGNFTTIYAELQQK